MMGNMRLLLTNDNSPAAIGVCNILENLPSRSILSNKHIFVMTGGLPYTEKQHKIITQVITDPSMIVIIIELRSRALSNYHLHLQRDYVYYLDGTISLQAITSHLKNILNSVVDEVKNNFGTLPEQSIVDRVTIAEKASIVGMLSNQSCKLYAETYGLSIRSVSEDRRNVIVKFGTCSPALLHAQLCVDSVLENNIVKATFNEKGTASSIYYARILQDLITLEGIKVLRDL